MHQFAFISRHEPSAEQVALAADVNVELTAIGDRDAFSFTVEDAEKIGKGFAGIVCVHPLIAMNAMLAEIPVGVFENANRAPLGQPPQFKAVRFVVRSGVVVADVGRTVTTRQEATS